MRAAGFRAGWQKLLDARIIAARRAVVNRAAAPARPAAGLSGDVFSR